MLKTKRCTLRVCLSVCLSVFLFIPFLFRRSFLMFDKLKLVFHHFSSLLSDLCVSRICHTYGRSPFGAARSVRTKIGRQFRPRESLLVSQPQMGKQASKIPSSSGCIYLPVDKRCFCFMRIASELLRMQLFSLRTRL